MNQISGKISLQLLRSQVPNTQHQYEETNKQQKITHVYVMSTSEDKPRKQMNSASHQEISEFNPSGQMDMEQLIKVMLNLLEEVKKFIKENSN